MTSKHKISEEDLIGARTDGMGQQELATELGTTRTRVCRAEKKYGIYLPRFPERKRTGFVRVRDKVNGLQPTQAVEFLLDLVEELMGEDVDPSEIEQYKLSSKEKTLLVALLSRKDRVVSEGVLLQCLYPIGGYPESDIIKVYMCKVRKKIRNSPWVIYNVHGQGYRLEEKEQEQCR